MPFYDDEEQPGFTPVGLPGALRMTPDPLAPEEKRLGSFDDPGRPPIMADALRIEGVEQPYAAEPTWGELFAASFPKENTIAAAVGKLGEDIDFGPEDPEHDPMTLIEKSKYEPYWRNFVDSRNERDTRHRMAKLDAEIKRREVVEAGGWAGVGTDMVASLLDWPTLIPGGVIYRGARTGINAAKSAAAVGAAAAGATTVQEGILQSLQSTRPYMESGIAIGGSFILGGLLGGAVSSMTSRNFNRLAKRLENEMRVPDNPEDDIYGIGGLKAFQEAGGVGAQRVNADVPPVELEGTFGAARAMAFQDPVSRTLHSPLPSAREAGTQLFETVLNLTRNADGVTTAPTGGAVETRIKMGSRTLYETTKAIDDAFAEYRFGAPKRLAAASSPISNSGKRWARPWPAMTSTRSPR
jgi:hypothetical protein